MTVKIMFDIIKKTGILFDSLFNLISKAIQCHFFFFILYNSRHVDKIEAMCSSFGEKKGTVVDEGRRKLERIILL